MTGKNFTSLKVRPETKGQLDLIKGNKESYNDIILRLMEENRKLNQILLNIENLEKHIRG